MNARWCSKLRLADCALGESSVIVASGWGAGCRASITRACCINAAGAVVSRVERALHHLLPPERSFSRSADPRLQRVMPALVRHLHAFVRDVEPTAAEWFAAIDFLTRTGKLCTDKRQEFVLLSDVLGVSMLVDAINNRRATGATASTLEGPFVRTVSPLATPFRWTAPWAS